jgi:taurine--2-oxoglutarate transaminase
MKMARLLTGRQKIMTRYRAYHGATFGAMSAGGDPRRLANEPGVPWIVRLHDPYAYRSPLYHGRSQAEGDQALVDQIAETIAYEGPQNIAAILLEGYSGASGIIQGGPTFWRGIQALCDQHHILLIIDEVMSGFGRTGEWFGINHYPEVRPDMMVMAKGLTSGYLPLGAVTVSDEVAAQLADQVFWGGLTYSGHTLACATAVANIEVIQQENLVEKARQQGKVLRQGLVDLAEKHPTIGEIRGTGLHFVLELVKNRETREPLSGFNQPMTEPMRQLSAALLANGLSTVLRWNWVFNTPPLIITEAEIREGLAILDQALTKADQFYEG